ncbi:MAG: terminase large subunit [Terriglobales bacterium]
MSGHVVRANAYIDDVLAGRIVTCRWTRAACQRQRDDLVRDWEYTFEAAAADDVCDFLELLTHIKGEFAGQAFHMEPWQEFIVTTVMGWRRKDNGNRRFRRLFLECGKGQGKSFLSSGLALYMLAADNQSGAEVVCAARASDQARLVFDTARDMVRVNPMLADAFGLLALQHSIVQRSTQSSMKPVSAQGKSLAGKLPHYASVDETWAHRSREVLDEMERGCDKSQNSLLSTITHAGENLASIGYEQHLAACKVLDGDLKDERTFCVIYSAEGFDWDSDDAMRAANPNLGVSVYEDTLRESRDRAVKLPTLQPTYKSHNLCLWEGSDGSWLDVNMLVACREQGLHMDAFKFWHVGEQGVKEPDEHRPFVFGLDLASSQDMAAAVFVCCGYLDGKEHYYAFGRYWLPEKTIETSPVSQYKGWATRKLLTAMPGSANNYPAIETAILSCYRQPLGYGAVNNPDGFRFDACAYDDWQSLQMVDNFEAAGIAAIKFAKNAKTYTPVMDWVAGLVKDGRLHFPADDAIMLWALSNVVCHRDANDNMFPRKPRNSPDRKIDAAVALLYAMGCARANDGAFVKHTAPNDGMPTMVFMYEDGSARQADGHGNLVEMTPLPPLKKESR